MSPSALAASDVDRYLRRLGLDPAAIGDLTIADLMRAHLVAVPFENLDIVFRGGVPHDADAGLRKVLSGRGGWCFELNESFARLLEALGYRVLRLGCAVLLDGPTEVLEHLALEVSGGPPSVTPHLVDVGFGDSFISPLDLNLAGIQHAGNADYELIPSPKGTTVAEYRDGVPAAQYRFKRVAHTFDDFAPAAHALQTDSTRSWSTKPFATRLLGNGSDRVTLRTDVLRVRTDGEIRERAVTRSEWDVLLAEWFSMDRPGPWPDER